jgi:hypothetical protein
LGSDRRRAELLAAQAAAIEDLVASAPPLPGEVLDQLAIWLGGRLVLGDGDV